MRFGEDVDVDDSSSPGVDSFSNFGSDRTRDGILRPLEPFPGEAHFLRLPLFFGIKISNGGGEEGFFFALRLGLGGITCNKDVQKRKGYLL
jgi:hypothetical protein